MIAESVAIAVFARAPVPGLAKTRLIPCLGPAGAAKLQRAFILRTLQTAQSARLGPVWLYCEPDCTHELFQQCRAEFGVMLYPQSEGDLGERMFAAFSKLCALWPTLLIGTDCPALTPAHLLHSAEALRQGDDAVFIPAEDGGYVLVGMRRAESFLFKGLPWSGPEVMSTTREHMRRNGWRWREPALLWDVDRPEDFERLRISGLMSDTAGDS